MDNEIFIFLYPNFLFILHLLDFQVISYRSAIWRYVTRNTPCSSLVSYRCDDWKKNQV